MEVKPIGPLMICVPTEASLKEDIEEMQRDAENDPSNAQYFELREQIFQNDLSVLNDPKNANVNPDTLAGAKDLLGQMEQLNSGLTGELRGFLLADPSLDRYGWTMRVSTK